MLGLIVCVISGDDAEGWCPSLRNFLKHQRPHKYRGSMLLLAPCLQLSQ